MLTTVNLDVDFGRLSLRSKFVIKFAIKVCYKVGVRVWVDARDEPNHQVAACRYRSDRVCPRRGVGARREVERSTRGPAPSPDSPSALIQRLRWCQRRRRCGSG